MYQSTYDTISKIVRENFNLIPISIYRILYFPYFFIFIFTKVKFLGILKSMHGGAKISETRRGDYNDGGARFAPPLHGWKTCQCCIHLSFVFPTFQASRGFYAGIVNHVYVPIRSCCRYVAAYCTCLNLPSKNLNMIGKDLSFYSNYWLQIEQLMINDLKLSPFFNLYKW